MILIVDMNWKKDSLGFFEFVQPIVSIVKNLDACIVNHYAELSQRDLRNSDCIVLSGTALKDNVTLSQPEEFTWLRDCDKPVLGICAGMQTIAIAFGLRLKTCLGIGMAEISTMKPNPLFCSTFKAYSLHNYSAEPSSEFEVLAENGKCVQAMKHASKPIYGVLFHPEVRNPEILQRFARKFCLTEDLNTNANHL